MLCHHFQQCLLLSTRFFLHVQFHHIPLNKKCPSCIALGSLKLLTQITSSKTSYTLCVLLGGFFLGDKITQLT